MAFRYSLMNKTSIFWVLMNKRWLFFLAFLLTGCSTSTQSISLDPPTEAIETPFVQPISTITPTPTSNCLVQTEYSRDISNPSGNLIIRKKQNLYLLSLSDLSLKLITSEETGFILISPSRKNFLVEQEIDYPALSKYKKIVLYDANGIVIKEYEKEDDWKGVPPKVSPRLNWINEENFAVAMSPLGSFTIININTDERREFIFRDGIKLYNPTSLSLFNYEGVVSLSPKLDQVFYSSERDKQIYLAVFNSLEENNNADYPYIIRWTRGYHDTLFSASWSPDGNYLAVKLSNTYGTERSIYDLYLINQHGMNVVQLTDFANFYPEAQFIHIKIGGWFPDGDHIGLLVRTANSKEELEQQKKGFVPMKLVIVNTKSRTMTDYCDIPVDIPYYSPDGKFIAIRDSIIDLEKKISYKITNGDIYGWLKTP